MKSVQECLRVTVILSVRNGATFLHQALDSVLAQSHRPHEILLIDGGSTDRSVEIALSYAGVRCLPQLGKGIPDANNQGIRAAEGELVAFLEHDDLWHPKKLEKQVHSFREKPDQQYSVTHFEFFQEPGTQVPTCFKADLFNKSHVGRIMSTLMARKSFFEALGFFDSSFLSAADVDWFARAKDSGANFGVEAEVLMRKRIHESNFSNLALVNNAEMLLALKKSVDRSRSRKSVAK